MQHQSHWSRSSIFNHRENTNHTRTHTHTCAHMRTHAHSHNDMVCAHIRTHIHIQVRTHHMHAHTRTHTHILITGIFSVKGGWSADQGGLAEPVRRLLHRVCGGHWGGAQRCVAPKHAHGWYRGCLMSISVPHTDIFQSRESVRGFWRSGWSVVLNDPRRR